jgi:ribonuclease HIII
MCYNKQGEIMGNTSVTLKIDELTFKRMINEYASFQEDNSNEYVSFFAHLNDGCVLTIYHSDKGFKALFTGENSLKEASKWDENATLNVPKVKVKTAWKNLEDQIGSDEVGTGDFFGPVVVVASYVPSSLIPYLKELGVDDSKKLSDEKIVEIISQIEKKIIFSRLICHPEKYNEMIDKGMSMNEIKAILHNQALTNVRQKIKDPNMPCFVDQFTSVDSYYEYLDKWNYKPLTNNITFETKGESYYPSVAVSSMIARTSFLKEMEKLSNTYKVDILKGASLKVDELSEYLVKKYGIEEVSKICKKNFKNYQKLLEIK